MAEDPWAQFPDAPQSAAPAAPAQADDPWSQFPDAPQAKQEPAPPAEHKTDVLRQIALIGRSAAEGVVNTLSLPHDMGIQFQNKIVDAVLSHMGVSQRDRELLRQPTGAEEFSKFMDKAGAYSPETPGEEFGSAVTRGVTGALTGAAAMGVTGANAVRAGVSGATGSASSEGARQMGFGPGVQAAAGTVGGLAPTAVEETARLAGRTAMNIVRPVTRGGQEQMAADILQNQADDAQAAAANLDQAQPVVPGSPRNTGEASKDVGLLSLEKGVRGRNPAAFGNRISEQNAARQTELADLAGTEADIAAAKAARNAQTGPMRDAAFAAGTQTADAPILTKIDDILASPVGERQIVKKALTDFRTQLEGKTDPARLYEIRKDINDAMMGKLGGEKSVYALARKQLGEVQSVLDAQIESAAPGFSAYLTRYKELSKPINQKEIIQEIQRRAQLTSADITTGQQFLGAAPFHRALDNALQEGSSTLSPDQVTRLNAIRTDLQYGQAINSPLVKAPGSDTFQNLSVAQAIGAGGSSNIHPAFRLLTKPLQWIYKLAGSDERVNEILTDAMLDPKLASRMLKRATPQSMRQFAFALRARVGAAGIGTVAAVNSKGSRPSKDQSIPAK